MAHNSPPWNVNEAGQNLGERYYDEALTPPQIGKHTKRGIVEGANSTETPVTQLNITDSFSNVISSVANQKTPEIKLTKSHDFFNWMESNNHIYKESCSCESCFQKTADYKGTVEKPFLA